MSWCLGDLAQVGSGHSPATHMEMKQRSFIEEIQDKLLQLAVLPFMLEQKHDIPEFTQSVFREQGWWVEERQ